MSLSISPLIEPLVALTDAFDRLAGAGLVAADAMRRIAPVLRRAKRGPRRLRRRARKAHAR